MEQIKKNNQSEEDYIECLYLLSQSAAFVHRVDVAKRLDVSQAAVNKAVNLLLDKGYVYMEGKHLYLTDAGKAYGRRVYERHVTIGAFLRALGVSDAVAEADACKLEHLVSEETFEKMKAFLEK